MKQKKKREGYGKAKQGGGPPLSRRKIPSFGFNIIGKDRRCDRSIDPLLRYHLKRRGMVDDQKEKQDQGGTHWD